MLVLLLLTSRSLSPCALIAGHALEYLRTESLLCWTPNLITTLMKQSFNCGFENVSALSLTDCRHLI